MVGRQYLSTYCGANTGPTGPRGDELIASIVTGVLFYAGRDAVEDDALAGHVEYGPLDPSTRELIAKATDHRGVREVSPEYEEGEWG